MSKICNHNDCENNVYGDKEQCILHCEKNNDTSIDEFNDYFSQYIKSKNEIEGELEIEDIYFPKFTAQVLSCLINNISEKIEYVTFKCCNFSSLPISSLNGKEMKKFIRFEYCVFLSENVSESIKYYGLKKYYVFCKCEFNFHIHISFEKSHYVETNQVILNSRLHIHRCKFTDLTIQDFKCKEDNLFFSIADVNCLKLENFNLNTLGDLKVKSNATHIINCEILEECSLKNIKTENLIVRRAKFNKKVTFSENKIQTLICEECAFEDEVDFDYITVSDYVNFRNSKFKKLDLSRANFIGEANFLGVEIENANRETFRIIKYAFDKIGNQIEANKFFAREMNERRKELFKPQKDILKNKKEYLEKLCKNIRSLYLWAKGFCKGICSFFKTIEECVVYCFNWAISNFGQSWLLPLFWMILLLIIKDWENTRVFFEQGDYSSKKILDWLNGLVQHIPVIDDIFKGAVNNSDGGTKNDKKDIFDLLYYIAFAILTWHLIISLKRLTRR